MANENVKKRLAICSNCLKYSINQQVFLVDENINEDRDESDSFNCQRHGYSEVIFIKDIMPSVE